MDRQPNDRLGWNGTNGIIEHRREILRANRDTNTYSHSDADSDTDSYGDDNSKPEPDRDANSYTNGCTEIYTDT